MKPLSKNITIFLLVIVALGVIFAAYQEPTAKPEIIGTSALVEKIKAGEVSKINIEEDKLSIFTGTEEPAFTVNKESGESLSDLLTNYGVDGEQLSTINIQVVEPSAAWNVVRSILPTLLFLVGFLLIFWFLVNQMQGANNRALTFGQSSAREVTNKKNKVTFKDVAGSEEAKEEVSEIVDFLKSPKKFAEVGAKIPKGVLLMGPPGTGKTLLAKAIAKESEANFILVNGPSLLSKWVGESEKAVREIFRKARQTAPTILFFDEIDALAPRRSSSSESKVNERVVNQMLTEMDGLESLNDVVIIAATNRPDILDPALLRQGRFDRVILVPVPKEEARKKILEIYLAKMPKAPDVDVDKLAAETEGYVGADLEGVCREAAMVALRENIQAKEVTMNHFIAALEIVKPSVDKEIEEVYDELKDYFSSARAKEIKDEKAGYVG